MTSPVRSLSLGARLGHAWRVRSVKGGAAAVIDRTMATLLRSWWRRYGPWFAGRASESFGPGVEIDGLRFEFPSSILTVQRGLASLGIYETPERYAVARFLRRSLPVVEFGGSAGVVACMTNKLLEDRTAHVVVEANPVMAGILEKNRDTNGCRFHVVNCALAYGTDAVEFPVAEDYLASSLNDGSAGQTVSVPATTLGALIEAHGFRTFSLVCDIEGAEMELVRHEGPVLSRSVAGIVMEVHPGMVGVEAVDQLRRDFDALGFSLDWRVADVWFLKNRSL